MAARSSPLEIDSYDYSRGIRGRERPGEGRGSGAPAHRGLLLQRQPNEIGQQPAGRLQRTESRDSSASGPTHLSGTTSETAGRSSSKEGEKPAAFLDAQAFSKKFTDDFMAEQAKQLAAYEEAARRSKAEADRYKQVAEAAVRGGQGYRREGGGGTPSSYSSHHKAGCQISYTYIIISIIFAICVILAFIALDRYNNNETDKSKNVILGIIVTISVALALGIGYIIYLNSSKETVWWGVMGFKDKLFVTMGILLIGGILATAIIVYEMINDSSKTKNVEQILIVLSSACLVGLFGSGYAYGSCQSNCRS